MKRMKHLFALVALVAITGLAMKAEAQINFNVRNSTPCPFTCAFLVDDGFGNLTAYGIYNVNPGPGVTTTITIPAPATHTVVAMRVYDSCCPGGGPIVASIGPLLGVLSGAVGSCPASGVLTNTAQWFSSTSAWIF